jgi:hypothetical protein
MSEIDLGKLTPHQRMVVRALANGESVRFDGDDGGDPMHDVGNIYVRTSIDHAGSVQVSQDDMAAIESVGCTMFRYQHNILEPWKAVFLQPLRSQVLSALGDSDGAIRAPKTHEEALRMIVEAIDNGEAKAFIRSTAERALELPAPEPAKVVITVEGGVVQCIDANTASLKAIVIDHDNEGGDKTLVTVPHLANDDPDAKAGENDAAIFEFTHEVMPANFFTDLERAAAEFHEANDLAAHESSVARP